MSTFFERYMELLLWGTGLAVSIGLVLWAYIDSAQRAAEVWL